MQALPRLLPRASGAGTWLILVGTAVALLAGYALSMRLYFLLVFAALFVMGAIVTFALNIRLGYQGGLMLLLVAAALVPVELGQSAGSPNGPVVLVAGICVVWAARLFIVRRKLALDGSRVVVAALVFMAIAVISFGVGQYPWFPTQPAPMRAQVGGLALFLLSGGLFLVVGHEIVALSQLRRSTWLFIGVGAVAVLTSVVSFAEVRVGSITLMDSTSIGSLFWVWLVAMSASQGLYNRQLPTLARLALLLVSMAALARGLFLAFSWASGWLPPLVALGVIGLMRFPRITLGVGLLLVAPLLLVGGPAFDAWMAGESYSSMTRLQALQVMWQIIERNPWLGFGPANYYHYTLLFPILGWWVRFNSHNNYVDLVAQTGFVGLVAFLWFAVEVFRLAWKLRLRVPAGFARAYVVGAIGGLAGSLAAGLLADWIVPFAYNIGIRGFRSSLFFWFFLGGLLALKRITAASAVLAAEPAAGPEPAFAAAPPPFGPLVPGMFVPGQRVARPLANRYEEMP